MEKIKGEGYEIIVSPGFSITKWDPSERRLYTSTTILEADAKISLLGERIAGLLLPPVHTSSHDLNKIIKIYRERVVAEQAVDLVSKLGPLARHARVNIAYFPLSRARMLWSDIGCLLKLNVEDVIEAYSGPARVAGDVLNSYIVIKPRKYREFLTTTLRKAQLATASWASTAIRFLRISNQYTLTICGSSTEKPDPSNLVDLPEGDFRYDCLGVEKLASIYTGVGGRCKKSNWTASTFICEGPEGRIAVKEYLRTLFKWVPASIVGSTTVNYLIRPKSRLYNEYKYLIELRRIIPTPRILSVCGDHARGVLVRSYMDGTPVIDSGDGELWRQAGETLASIHNNGYVLGDPNPGNFVYMGEGLALIDAEQARKFTPKLAAWDLIVYVYYPILFNKDLELIVRGLEGYMDNIDPRMRKKIIKWLKDRRIWIGLSFLPVQYRKARRVFYEAGIKLT